MGSGYVDNSVLRRKAGIFLKRDRTYRAESLDRARGKDNMGAVFANFFGNRKGRRKF